MRILLIWCAYHLLTPATLAQTAPEDLRQIARNPFANEIKLPFEEDFTFSQGKLKRVTEPSCETLSGTPQQVLLRQLFHDELDKAIDYFFRRFRIE
jgi:hypothetical protein